MTKTRVTISLLVLLLVVAGMLTLTSLLQMAWLTTAFGLGAIVLFALLLFAATHGWRWTGETLVVLLVMLTALTTDPVYLQTQIALTVFVPVVVAAILLTPGWTFGVYLLTMAAMALSVAGKTGQLSADTLGPTYMLVSLVLTSLIVGGIALASLVASRATHEAQQSARQAQASQQQAEAAQHVAEQRATELLEKTAEQESLLALVSVLETPTLTLADGVLVVPLVGHLDTRRTELLRERLLEAAHVQRARLVIIDISGIAVVDTAVAQALLQTARMLRLLGCAVTISGISAPVAITMTDLGIDLADVRSSRTPEEALNQYIHQQAAYANSSAN